ncbi:MAG: ATP-binding protein [Patescibacteria group bacterium]|jgi:predicted HTH transcriptional regulator
MFNEEFSNYIIRRHEEQSIEYKGSLNWNAYETKINVLKAMLAMANNDQGGVIVLGVKEEKDRSVSLSGMTDSDFQSFNYDDIARFIKRFCDPIIEFTIFSDNLIIDDESKNFIILQIHESIEPTVCTDFALFKKQGGNHYENIALRKNAIYIRSKAPIESREISSIHEWRELLDRMVQKKKEDILKKLPCVNLLNVDTETDSDKFNTDLIKDNL